MSHNLMERNGKTAMFVVGNQESAWHRLGQRTPNAATWAEAMKLADLDWQVIRAPQYASNPLGKTVELPVYALFRSDDGEYLGTVKGRYQPIQNKDAFSFVDGLLEADNGAHYDSAGALGHGERIWCAARVPFDFQIDGGDKHETYLLFTTSHDGSEAAETKLTTVRVVCQNTLQSALQGGGANLKFKHTASAKDRMASAVRLMTGAGASVKALEEKLSRLAETKVTRETAETLFNRLFPTTEATNPKRRDEKIEQILSLYESNDNNAFPSVKGTAYNLLNAVTEYTDHYRTVRTAENKDRQMVRAEAAVSGAGDTIKQVAMEVLLASTGNADLLESAIANTRY